MRLSIFPNQLDPQLQLISMTPKKLGKQFIVDYDL